MRRKCAWIGVAFLAIICGAFGSRECGEDRATECKEKLLDILLGDFTEKEACEQLYGVSKCLRNVVEDCLGEEEHPEVEQSLKEFEDFLDDNCAAEGDNGDKDEVMKCLDKNEDYLMNCVIDTETGEISRLLQPESIPAGIEPEFMQCYLYGLMAQCIGGRSEEKCGVAGGERAAELLSEHMPPSVQESCDSQQDGVEGSVKELFSVNVLDQRKKRDLDYRKKRQLVYRKKRAPLDWTRDIDYTKFP